VLKGALPENSIVLLVDLNTLVDDNSETWRGSNGRNGLFNLNPGDGLLGHSLSITNTMLEHDD